MNNKLTAAAILVLAVSIIFSSLWFGSKIEGYNTLEKNQGELDITEKALLTEEEASQYLGITEDEFEFILVRQITKRRNLDSFQTYSFIPFIMVKGNRYFNKEEIDKWVEYNVRIWKAYD